MLRIRGESLRVHEGAWDEHCNDRWLFCAGFRPHDVFRSLYRRHCMEAWGQVEPGAEPEASVQRCQQVEDEFTSLYARMVHEQIPSRDLHAQTLDRYRAVWERISTHRVCLSCVLGRKPQHVLACGHAICDVCVEMRGRPLVGAECRYVVACCPLCQQTMDVEVRLLPKTAAVRVITIDGGGVRGVIPLRLLLEMQKMLGDECPLADLVDVVGGTSSGRILFRV